MDFTTIQTTLINTVPLMASFLGALLDIPTSPPSLYLDLEGINLSRHGTLAIVSVFVAPQNRVYLIDVHVLGERAFSTKGSKGETFKGVLESNVIPKVLFYLRNDSDALYSHFQVRLSGVIDVQLMELATRPRQAPRTRVNGLARCIRDSEVLAGTNKAMWEFVKKWGKEEFTSAEKGNKEVWNERPLPDMIMDYCSYDVAVLPLLWALYDGKLGTDAEWRGKVEKETVNRVIESQSEDYLPNGAHKTFGPGPWRNWEGDEPTGHVNYLEGL